LTEEEWYKFKEENPELAKYFENPEPEVLDDLPIPADIPE
jgi:hypothetical protein